MSSVYTRVKDYVVPSLGTVMKSVRYNTSYGAGEVWSNQGFIGERDSINEGDYLLQIPLVDGMGLKLLRVGGPGLFSRSFRDNPGVPFVVSLDSSRRHEYEHQGIIFEDFENGLGMSRVIESTQRRSGSGIEEEVVVKKTQNLLLGCFGGYNLPDGSLLEVVSVPGPVNLSRQSVHSGFVTTVVA